MVLMACFAAVTNSLQANVVISDDGVPLLCDFGLASVCDGDEREAMSTTVRRAGSARHMAIELHQSDSPGSSVTRQSDMWAFGIVLHRGSFPCFLRHISC